jgi:hypothetical protein
MNMAVIALMLMCAICAALGIYRGIANERQQWARRQTVPAGSRGLPAAPRSRVPPPQRIYAEELLRRMTSEHDLILVRLVDSQDQVRNLLATPGEITATLEHLQESLPWMPASAKLAIYRSGGISPQLGRKLERMAQDRQLLFLVDELPRGQRSLHPLGGVPWS